MATFRALTTTKRAAAAPVRALSPYLTPHLLYCPSLTTPFSLAFFSVETRRLRQKSTLMNMGSENCHASLKVGSAQPGISMLAS